MATVVYAGIKMLARAYHNPFIKVNEFHGVRVAEISYLIALKFSARNLGFSDTHKFNLNHPDGF